MKSRRSDSSLLLFVLFIGMVAFASHATAQSPNAGGPSPLARLRARGVPGPKAQSLLPRGADFNPGVVTSFSWDWNGFSQFPESIAIDRDGKIYASVTDFWFDNSGPNVGHVVSVSPDGKQKVVATIPVPDGILTGVAFDDDGRLYVNVWSGTPGVYRINHDGSTTCVLTLPDGSGPNGIAFYGDVMYVSDSALGAIWKKGPGDSAAPTTAWFEDYNLIGPYGGHSDSGLGANGIAFYRDGLYIAVYDAGRIVRVPLNDDGSPGEAVLVVQDIKLEQADGIAFDVRGTIWVTLNFINGLGTVARDGTFTLVEDNPGWLDYPTQGAFGTTPETRTTLFVSNGGFMDGVSNIISLDVGVRGRRLPAE